MGMVRVCVSSWLRVVCPAVCVLFVFVVGLRGDETLALLAGAWLPSCRACRSLSTRSFIASHTAPPGSFSVLSPLLQWIGLRAKRDRGCLLIGHARSCFDA